MELGNPGQGFYFIAEALSGVLSVPGSVEQPISLFFGLPYQLPIDKDQPPRVLACAWAYDEFPPACNRAPISDWRRGLETCCGALVFSQQAAGAIRRLMGDDYPVQVLPAQPAERFAGLCADHGELPHKRPRMLVFRGHLLDSPRIGLSVDGLARLEPQLERQFEALPESEQPVAPPAVPGVIERLRISGQLVFNWWHEAVVAYVFSEAPQPAATAPEVAPSEHPQPSLIEPAATPPEQRLKLFGTVYTCILRAEDERCRWMELLTAFCWTFRDEPNATLVLKFTHHKETSGLIPLLTTLSRLSPFRCRVVAINAFLETQDYAALIATSDYLVTPHEAEASALTAQEFLSAGRPVIGPVHGALADWLTAENAFLVGGDIQPAYWNGDIDKKLHHQSLRLNWTSLCQALADSFRMAQQAPECYRAKSRAARTGMLMQASHERISEVVRTFLSKAVPVQTSADVAQAIS